MDNNSYQNSTDSNRPSQSARGQGKESGRITTAARVFRAVTAIVVFGIPLIAGSATLLGYGFYKAYKRVADRS
jgi:hypothetical protein